MKIGEFLNTQLGFFVSLGGLVVFLLIVALILSHSEKKKFMGRILIPLGFIGLSVIFYLITTGFKKEGDVGPAVVPRLWMFFLVVLNLYLLIRGFTGKEGEDPEKGRIDTVFLFVGLIVLYLVAIQILGYFLSTFLFIVIAMYMLSYKNHKVIISTALGWLIFSYFAFFKLLFVPLPKGWIFSLIFG